MKYIEDFYYLFMFLLMLGLIGGIILAIFHIFFFATILGTCVKFTGLRIVGTTLTLLIFFSPLQTYFEENS